MTFAGGVSNRSVPTSDEFCFDNETPRHPVVCESDFGFADRLVPQTQSITAFICDDGGYRDRNALWMSDGWSWLQRRIKLIGPSTGLNRVWKPNLHLSGMQRDRSRRPGLPHISFYEADAFARWRGCPLCRPSSEWEIVVAARTADCRQLRGEVVACIPNRLPDNATSTRSATGLWRPLGMDRVRPYCTIPRVYATDGRVRSAKYNGKFMCNQMVCRGGSCATPTAHHVRCDVSEISSILHERWQFFGIRLARDTYDKFHTRDRTEVAPQMSPKYPGSCRPASSDDDQ